MKNRGRGSWQVGIVLILAAGGALTASNPGDQPTVVFHVNGPTAHCVAYSPDGRTIAVAGKSVELWEVLTGKRRAILPALGRGVSSLAFSGDGKFLASGGPDGNVLLWDMATATLKATVPGTASKVTTAKGTVTVTDRVSCLAFSTDGKLVAAAGDDTTITVWDTATAKVKTTLKGHSEGPARLFTYSIMSVAFSPDNTLLASGGNDGCIKLWDLSNARMKASLVGSSETAVSSVAFSPDGKQLASGNLGEYGQDEDHTVKVWSVATGEVTAVCNGHRYAVSAVAFSPDGKLLASVSGAGLGDSEWEEPPDNGFEIMLWDVATGQKLAGLEGETGQMCSVAFSPDGKFLATGDWSDLAFPETGPGAVRQWDVRAMLKAKK